jgi:DNA repair exonuclease SbcCD ATPase subunit
MIHFKLCRWKNFLSTGNEFTEIQFDRSPTTLIVGQNGAGKSTLLDALSFGLFGKSHRDIKKDQLINSINKKHCVVEVEFKIGSSEFKIHRAIKPGKFEIYQNGNLINQSSSARDYQKFLEQNILKLNHKSFHQVVVLGSSSFIPFMQLPSHSRREVIEDLLDINIFSKMNGLLKERNGKIKEEIKDLSYQIQLINGKIDTQNKYIKNLESLNEDQIDGKRKTIRDHKKVIDQIFAESKDLGDGLTTRMTEDSTSYEKLNDHLLQLKTKDMQYKNDISQLVKTSKFYEEHTNCPTCDQVISEDKKAEKQEELKVNAVRIQSDKTKAATAMDELNASIATVLESINELKEKQAQILSNNEKISVLQGEVDKTQKEINSLSGQSGDLKNAKVEFEGFRESKDSLNERKLKYLEERTYNEVIGEMLKDTGIKTKVIKQYLPVMNKMINQYLQVLDFFVAFHLDESFNETIKSRHRDAFNYSSFSEGEKQRIDLSLLFTWRQVAKMKNSAATNLLILDETFDSSLDVDGVDSLTKILDTLEDGSNVFIISHKGDVLENKFRSKIEFIKERNFSKVK